MKTLYMTKGLPASGKSTRAKSMLAEFGSGNAKRVNKDDLRAMLDDGQWSKGNEKFLVAVRDFIVRAALQDGKHVIVDDTNLATKHEAALRVIAKDNGAVFEIVDFTHVSVDECIERDRKRAGYVGERVIRDMYRQFLAPLVEAPPRNENLPDAMIVDIDGTVAQMNGRGPFDWARVGEDSPRKIVMEIVQCKWKSTSSSVIFMSGRDSCCRPATEAWLIEHFGSGTEIRLFMRPEGDSRKDAIVKRELYERHVKGKYNVVALFDDRPQMIRCWQELGFGDRIFNVGDGVEF